MRHLEVWVVYEEVTEWDSEGHLTHSVTHAPYLQSMSGLRTL